jgi:hypothetical protein
LTFQPSPQKPARSVAGFSAQQGQVARVDPRVLLLLPEFLELSPVFRIKPKRSGLLARR